VILRVKYGHVMQQDRVLQKQSLLGPCFPPSSTNTYVQLDVNGDFGLDPSGNIKASLPGNNT